MRKIFLVLLACMLSVASQDTFLHAMGNQKDGRQELRVEDLGIPFDLTDIDDMPYTRLSNLKGTFHKYMKEDGYPAYDIDANVSGSAGVHKQVSKYDYHAAFLSAYHKEQLSLILIYGYNGIARYGRNIPEQHVDEYVATQIAIWLMLDGIRLDCRFESVMNEFVKLMPRPENVKSIINKIYKQVYDHGELPSISSYDNWNLPHHMMNYNEQEKRYEITLQDTNYIVDENGQRQPVLKYYDIDMNSKFSRDYYVGRTDDTLTFHVPVDHWIGLSSAYIILNRKYSEYLDPVDSSSDKRLQLQTYDVWSHQDENAAHNDKVALKVDNSSLQGEFDKASFVSVELEKGRVKFIKNDEITEAPVAGFKFKLYYSDTNEVVFNKEYTTGANGEVIVYNIPSSKAHSFYIQEVRADGNGKKYYLPEVPAPKMTNPGDANTTYEEQLIEFTF